MSDIDYDTPAVETADVERLAWHMRMIRAAQTELGEIDQLASNEISRVEEWRDMRRSAIEARIAWHSAPIRSYHEMRISVDASVRTIHTPHGQSKITTPRKPIIDVTDRDGVIGWAEANAPHLVERRVLVTDLRRCLADTRFSVDGDRVIDTVTGEIVPGVTAQVPAPRWRVDTDPGSPL